MELFPIGLSNKKQWEESQLGYISATDDRIEFIMG